MTSTEALETNIARTGNQDYRRLCADSHPKHEKWRREMVRMATEPPPPPPRITVDYAPVIPSGRSCCG